MSSWLRLTPVALTLGLCVSTLLPTGVAFAAFPDTGALVDELDRIRLKNNVAAFGVVFVDDNGIVHLETRGLADRATGTSIKGDAVFRIGSVTKMFTGLAALELARTTDFDIDAPLTHWPMTDYYQNPWQPSPAPTVAMLLEHTAGLTDMIQEEWDFSDPRQRPLSETLRLYPQARQLQWPPGMHASYSNAGAGLAGRAMELAAGRSFEELMESLVFQPMALNDSTVLPPKTGLPTGYDSDGVTPIPYWNQIFRPFAAINSSLHDLGRFITMLINQGQLDGKVIFPATLVDRLETPQTRLAARSGITHGYGLGNYQWIRNGVLFHGHGGDADGYLSRLAYTRTNNRGYFLVITAFQRKTLRTMERRIENFLIEGIDAAPEPPIVKLDEKEIARRVGVYAQTTWRFPGSSRTTMRIFAEDGELYTELAGQKAKPLLALGDTFFRRSYENQATIFLGPGPGGEVIFQEGMRNFTRLHGDYERLIE